MMQLEQKNELKNAMILLKCDKTNHNDCRLIRDALLEQYPNVRKAITTNTRIKGEKWCVAASALVNLADEEKFEKGLWNLKAGPKKNIGISNVHFIIDQQ